MNMAKNNDTVCSNVTKSSGLVRKKTTNIEFDHHHSCECSHFAKRLKVAANDEEKPKSLQISESTIELMKDISVSEIPGIRGKVARDLFRNGYVHMYFLAREFMYKFEADEIRFQDWLKKTFALANVDANRAVRAIRKILFDDTDDLGKQKKALAAAKAEIQNLKSNCRCGSHNRATQSLADDNEDENI